MEGFPKEGTKEEIRAWLEERAPEGTLSYNLDTLPNINELRTLRYIENLRKYATPQELLIRLPFKDLNQGKTVTVYNESYVPTNIHLRDETLMNIFGSLPPYHGNVEPTVLPKLSEFPLDILKPIYPNLSIPDDVEVPRNLKNEVNTCIERIEAEIERDRHNLELNKEIIINPESTWQQRVDALTKALSLNFKIYNDVPKVSKKVRTVGHVPEGHRIGDPIVDLQKKFHAFLGTDEYDEVFQTMFKENKRLTSKSKQLQFARIVGGLIIYLLTHAKKEEVLSVESKDLVKNLFQEYMFGLLSTTSDGIAMKNHLKRVIEPINEYLGYELILIDCQNERTERCPRGLIPPVEIDGHYKIVFTDVNERANVTDENQIRLMEKYSAKGGKRKTRKQKAKKKMAKSRRWQKRRML